MDGGGAQRFGARWNSPGRRAVYAAETYAGALLEIVVHANLGRVPQDLVWVRITIPPSVRIIELDDATLGAWNSSDYLDSREAGDTWLRAGETAVLTVPSAATAGVERNFVFNPDHREFKHLAVTEPQPVQWDFRLFGSARHA